MKELLILKTGSTYSETARHLGDFEDWIIDSISVPKDEWHVIDCRGKPDLPTANQFKAIIITGSHDNITDKHPWIRQTQDWLKQAGVQKIPIFGICFGHQLLASAFGSVVGFAPMGLEIGTKSVQLTEEAKSDLLFHYLPGKFLVNESHEQAVLTLPPNARILAGNSHTTIQAMVIYDHMWGVQFHPEFSKIHTRVYFDADKKDLTDEQVSRTILKDTPVSRSILQHFVDLVRSGSVAAIY